MQKKRFEKLVKLPKLCRNMAKRGSHSRPKLHGIIIFVRCGVFRRRGVRDVDGGTKPPSPQFCATINSIISCQPFGRAFEKNVHEAFFVRGAEAVEFGTIGNSITTLEGSARQGSL